MAHTNSTTNYNLPQFLTSDKPAWLTDVNNAFSDIDAGMYAAQTKADTAFTDAGNAQTDATTAINNAAAADAKGSGALASIETTFDPTTIYSVGAKVIYNSLLYRCIVAVTTPGPWTGSDNWERITVDNLISTIDSKVGVLSALSTTDKSSAVAAINEVNGTKMDKAITVDVDGAALTISHIDNIYTIGLKACPVSAIYSNLAAYTTSKIFRFAGWDMTYNKPCFISIGEGQVYVFSDTWTVIPNTDNRTVSAGATYIKI